MFKNEYLAPGRQEPEKITASGILEAYNIMKADAVGIGKQDLAAGLPFLLSQKDLYAFKWVSANLVRKSDKKPIFTPGIIKKVGNISIGITGLTGSPSNNPFRPDDDAAIVPWKKVLPGILAELDKTCDLIILLSSLSQQDNTEIATLYDNIHIILQSSPRASNIQPILNNNTLTIQTISKGKYLGQLDVNWQSSNKWAKHSSSSLESKKSELERLNKQLNRYKDNQRLLERKKQLVAQLQLLQSEQKNTAQTGQTPSTYKNIFIPLDTNLPDQSAVLKVVQNITRKINEQGRHATQKTTQKTGAQPENYVGWHICNTCHKKQSTVWQKSRHARSHQTLINKKQEHNSSCVPCHVTGVFTGKEPYALSLSYQLRQVGCESCHGPGLKHSKDPRNTKMVATPAETTCRRCHTAERDDTFNYTADIKLLACPSAKH